MRNKITWELVLVNSNIRKLYSRVWDWNGSARKRFLRVENFSLKEFVSIMLNWMLYLNEICFSYQSYKDSRIFFNSEFFYVIFDNSIYPLLISFCSSETFLKVFFPLLFCYKKWIIKTSFTSANVIDFSKKMNYWTPCEGNIL